MAPNTLPGEAFLNDFYIDQELRAALEPGLYFNNVLPINDTTERSVIYNVLENTAAKDLEDGIMSLPAPAGEEAALTKLKMRNVSELKGKIPKIGYEFDVSRETLNSKNKTLADLNLKIKKAAYGVTYAVNALSLAKFAASAKASTYSIPTTWGDASGKQNPIADLIEGFYEFKNKEYPNMARNWFMHDTNHKELVQYLTNREIDFSFGADGRTLTVPGKAALANMSFKNVEDQFTLNSALAMDLTNPQSIYPGAEYWRYIDPKFAVQVPQADPKEETQYTGVHVNITEMEKNPFTTTVEVWLNILPVVKIEDVIMTQAGL